jgi:hypothetical protein
VADVRAVVDRWFRIEDDAVLPIMLGCTLAHLHTTDEPVWMLTVSPPGSGKTELFMGLVGLPGVYPLSEITAHTFASGFDKPGKADPSLLRKGGLTNEILLFKDFTSVLEMRYEERQGILAQLREIYDGKYTKKWGTGRSLDWEGRLGFLAGVTPIVDKYQGALSLLGERFIMFRPHTPKRSDMAHKALTQSGQQHVMRAELRTAIHGFIEQRRTARCPNSMPTQSIASCALPIS